MHTYTKPAVNVIINQAGQEYLKRLNANELTADQTNAVEIIKLIAEDSALTINDLIEMVSGGSPNTVRAIVRELQQGKSVHDIINSPGRLRARKGTGAKARKNAINKKPKETTKKETPKQAINNAINTTLKVEQLKTEARQGVINKEVFGTTPQRVRIPNESIEWFSYGCIDVIIQKQELWTVDMLCLVICEVLKVGITRVNLVEYLIEHPERNRVLDL